MLIGSRLVVDVHVLMACGDVTCPTAAWLFSPPTPAWRRRGVGITPDAGYMCRRPREWWQTTECGLRSLTDWWGAVWLSRSCRDADRRALAVFRVFEALEVTWYIKAGGSNG